MSDQRRQTASTWLTDTRVPCTPQRLPRRSTTDVCIIGGGITGLSTAYSLRRAGARVTLLEAATLASGETGRTTAHLASAMDDRFVTLERLHGREKTALVAASHTAAIARIEENIHRESIECDFARLDGYLYLGAGQTREVLVDEAAAAVRAGLVAEVLEVPVGPPLAAGPCLRFAAQAQLHPTRYLAGLARAIEALGGQLYEGTRVVRIEPGLRPRAVTADGDVVECSAIVVATGSPISERLFVHAQQSAYRTYVVAMSIAPGAIPLGLYWDNEDPYHYVRLDTTRRHDGQHTLIVGGADHRTGEKGDLGESHWMGLETWARVKIEKAGPVVARWSGQIYEPADRLALIGASPSESPGVFIATGDSGHGMTYGTIAGIMLTDLVTGGSHPWASLYDPRRLTVRALGTLAKDGLHGVAHYADWLGGSAIESERSLARGEGAIVARRGRRLAVHAASDGTCVRLSSACTHARGPVAWNGSERSWDCPVHGSRFDARGRVLCGPAVRDLQAVDAPQPQPQVAAGAPRP